MMLKCINSWILVPLLFCVCQKADSKDQLASVGGTILDRDQFEAFRKVTRIYPSPMNDAFPGQRSFITYMIETQAIYKKAQNSPIASKIKSSHDWTWKKRYFPAQIYVSEVLSENLGITEQEITNYYNANKDEFKNVIKNDSTKKDSVVYQTQAEVKDKIVEKLFMQKYPPDPEFLKSLGDSLPDSLTIKNEWVTFVKNDVQSFFMKKFFEQDFKKKYPDSLKDIYGEGKIITPKDMDVILSWVPEGRREQYKTPEGTKELSEWLLKWKIFADRADQSGIMKKSVNKWVLDYALRVEVASKYVENEILPKAKKIAKIDSSMALYSYYDDVGNPDAPIDTAALNRSYSSALSEQVTFKVDSIVHSLRKAANVKFIQADWKDEREQDYKKLLAKADSLRDTGSTDDAENNYRLLSVDFPFTEEGRKATIELAKIQTEKQMYQQAIKNYRRYLIEGADASKKCNIFFMIGFIYDEYLDRPEMAELNYKWVLKNTPDCELSDDAEFMMLHLGEPMSSVEELQAEAKRQGRKIEPIEEEVAPETAPTDSGKKAN